MGSVDESSSGSRGFARLLGYLIAICVCSILIAWLVAKMTRTDAADFRVLVMAAVIGVGMLAFMGGFARRS